MTEPAWAVPEMMAVKQPYMEFIHAVDWGSTPLGPMEHWSAPLQRSVSQVLADSRPIAMYWGAEEHTTIYNEAFSKLSGSRHPFWLGRPVEDFWPEAGAVLQEMLRRGADSNKKKKKLRASTEGEWRFFVEREPDAEGQPSWLEETYLKWSMIPIHEDEELLGFIHPLLDTTSMRLWERRMKMLVELGDVLVTARDVDDYWDRTIEGLQAVDPSYDIPLAVLYSVAVQDKNLPPDERERARAPPGPNMTFRLAGTLGAPPGHPIRQPVVHLRTDDGPLATMLREVMARGAAAVRQPMLVHTEDGTLPAALLDGLHWRGFHDPCRSAVLCPIRPTKDEDIMGLLLLGLNPRRPYDNDYLQYILLLTQKLTTSFASTVLLEEEARRRRNTAVQAAYDQAELQKKLAFQTTKATESDQKFQTVAEFVPVGMCFGDDQDNITFANDAWYRITGYPTQQRISSRAFLAHVKDEDQMAVIRAYDDLRTVGQVTFEFRIKRPGLAVPSASPSASPSPSPPAQPTRTSPNFENDNLDLASLEQTPERHVLASAKAERHPDGSIIRVLTCLTDVTLHRRTAEEAVRRAQEAENLKRMAEFATVGMYDMDLSGRLLGANNVFFEMCGIPKVDLANVTVRPWETALYSEDYPTFAGKLERMIDQGKSQNLVVRLKTTWTAEDGSGQKVLAPRWVQTTLLPVSSGGAIRSFTGCLSDVSLQKWQLEREKLRKEEAIESKRQQESFIDMYLVCPVLLSPCRRVPRADWRRTRTSHEMRNPLGAIVHCTDSIVASMSRAQQLIAADASELRELRELVDNSIDDAETILACASHQKRIVDDILTMSKLDSKLLSMTPITVDSILLLRDAVKMFEVEARRVDINLSMVVDDSFKALGFRYLDFDPSRVNQVLINLLTNALKFTKSGPSRNVTVGISASRSRPTDATSSVTFIPRAAEGNYEQPALLNRGAPVFLSFEVKDTGTGLTEAEKKSLFKRFAQASTRTHVKYGGSGLGLFISRRLTELQNGAIGVASEPDVGSTFTFYIESYVPGAASVQEAEAAAAGTAMLATGGGSGSGSSGGGGGRAGRPGAADKGSGGSGLKTLTSAARSPGGAQLLPVVPSGGLDAPISDIKGVLVVEDNLINQQITRRHLVGYGLNVDVANHGVECLEKLRSTDRWREKGDGGGGGDDEEEKEEEDGTHDGAKTRPTSRANSDGASTATATGSGSGSPGSPRFALSIILMDVEMPLMDGLTCTRRIRALERAGRLGGGRMPIIAVSANARVEQMLEAREAGCDDVLVKPYRMPELLERMRVLVARPAR